jgi:hypothetical protein
MPREGLILAVVEASLADEWPEAKLEWSVSNVEILPGRKKEACSCGQQIREIYSIMNNNNGEELRIGSDCVRHFGREDLDEEAAEMKRELTHSACLICEKEAPLSTGSKFANGRFVCCRCMKKRFAGVSPTANCLVTHHGVTLIIPSSEYMICHKCACAFHSKSGSSICKGCAEKKSAIDAGEPLKGEKAECPSCLGEIVKKKHGKNELCFECHLDDVTGRLLPTPL